MMDERLVFFVGWNQSLPVFRNSCRTGAVTRSPVVEITLAAATPGEAITARVKKSAFAGVWLMGFMELEF